MNDRTWALRLRERCPWALLRHTVDDEVDLLVVEADQAGDLGALLGGLRYIQTKSSYLWSPAWTDQYDAVPLYGHWVTLSDGSSSSVRTSESGR